MRSSGNWCATGRRLWGHLAPDLGDDMMRWALVMASVLAGCAAPEGTPATQTATDTAGLAYVEIGEGGSFSGSTVFRVYETGAWTFEAADSFAAPTRRTDMTDPAAFEATRAAALRGIAALGPVSSEACPDYGTDFVVVSTGSGIEAEVYASCPDSGVPDVIRTVREAFSAAASS